MLSIRHIVKQYAGHRALNDVSLEVESGQIFGLLGPNGAGKTSLIRIVNQITKSSTNHILNVLAIYPKNVACTKKWRSASK